MTQPKAPDTADKPRRPPRPNYNQIHAKPLPLAIHPLPTLTLSNPLSLLHILHIYLSPLLSHLVPSLALTSHQHAYRAYFDEYTKSVHVTDPDDIRGLWEHGFFGKGSLSRSEPEWLALQKKKQEAGSGVKTSAEVTRKRREERKELKRERAYKEMKELEEQLAKERNERGANGPTVAEMEEKYGQLEERAAELAADNEVLGQKRDSKVSIISEEHNKEDIRRGQKTQSTSHQDESENTLQGAKNTIPIALPHITNQEHLQLNLPEAFFLHSCLGILTIFPHPSRTPNTEPNVPLSTTQLLRLFRRISYSLPSPSSSLSFPPQPLRPDDPFLVSYIAYHHFRSLGWVVRSGVKFAVDWLLYYRGPAFSHAEFAVVVIPSYKHSWWKTQPGREYLKEGQELGVGEKKRDWYWLHAVGRVQAQVRKSLVLVYVEVPPPADIEQLVGNDTERDGPGFEVDLVGLLSSYRVSEFVVRRWSPNRNR